MADNETTNTIVESLDGPGKSKQPVKIKGDIKSVARLSKNTKLVMFSLVSVVVVGIAVGTMTAGNKPSTDTTQQDNAGADSVNTVMPTADLMPQQKIDPNKTPTDPANMQPNNGQLTARGTPSSTNQAVGATGNTAAPLTPAQQHQAWLVQQHYKRLEGKVLAADAAISSETSKGGASNLLAANNAGTNTGMDRIQDAQTAALRMMANDPKAAQLPDMQNLLKALSNGSTSTGGNGDDAGQKANKQFLADNSKQDDGYLASAVMPKENNHELFAGSVIPAVLVSGIDSDLPGVILAMVRQTVYDSLNPNVVLIPQGTKLIGQYSSAVAYGQSRVLVAWGRLIFPNGATIDLKGMMGADAQGLSGFNDQVDNHYLKTFGSAVLISLLGVGAQLSQPQTSTTTATPTAASTSAAAMAASLNQTGSTLLGKNLGIQPTLKIRQGYVFNVMVSRTMIMPPYLAR